MSRSTSRRFLRQSLFSCFTENASTARILPPRCQQFSHTVVNRIDNEPIVRSKLYALGSVFEGASDQGTSRRPPLLDTNTISSDGTLSPRAGTLLGTDGTFKETTWQLHVYAHRHNIHITLARPPAWCHPVTGKVYGENPPSRSVALSLSAGRLGFRHSGRKHYDSAFQLATYVMARMQDNGINAFIDKLEVYLRGFGAGREAVTRVLLGTEGKHIRNKIVKVADSTRLKFGGTRSANPRRLG